MKIPLLLFAQNVSESCLGRVDYRFHQLNKDSYQGYGALEEVLEEHLRIWERIYGGRVGESLGGRFRSLLERAYETTGRGCVVLVDEYDKSLLEVLEHRELEEHNKSVFKGFFSALKSYDRYLHFVFITGVTKFSKVSIFSDLNQLNDITLDPDYACICGITERELEEKLTPEVRKLATSMQVDENTCLMTLRNMYDGYHFSPHQPGVYNPFSLLKAFFSGRLGSYWFATGTPTFLTKQVKKMRLDAAKFTNQTIFASEATMTDYRFDNPDPVPLLYQTGYLTIWDYDGRRQRYALGFPNDEVKYGGMCMQKCIAPGGGRIASWKRRILCIFLSSKWENPPEKPCSRSKKRDMRKDTGQTNASSTRSA